MTLAEIFVVASAVHGLPHTLLSDVCFVESSHRPKVSRMDSNGHKSVGLCQMQLPTARFLGFRGSESDLLNPRTNAFYAGKYLAYQYRRYGSWVKAIKAYNAGSSKTDLPNDYFRKVTRVSNKNYLQ